MEIEDFISTERLRTYQNHTDQQKKAIALHNHTLQLGTSLMAIIALLELSLRNITNQLLIEDFGDDEWLLPDHTTLPLKPFECKAISKAYSQAQKTAYSKLSYKEKSDLDAQAYPNGIPPNTKHKTVVKRRNAYSRHPMGRSFRKRHCPFGSDYILESTTAHSGSLHSRRLSLISHLAGARYLPP